VKADYRLLIAHARASDSIGPGTSLSQSCRMVILLFPPVPIERDILAFFAAIDPLPASNIDLESHTANKTRSRFGSTSRHYW